MTTLTLTDTFDVSFWARAVDRDDVFFELWRREQAARVAASMIASDDAHSAIEFHATDIAETALTVVDAPIKAPDFSPPGAA